MSEKKIKLNVGIVTSAKMDKVAVVKIESFDMHSVYHKRISKTKKYFIRDAENKCKEGDKVSFFLSSPQSKKTKHMLKEILKS